MAQPKYFKIADWGGDIEDMQNVRGNPLFKQAVVTWSGLALGWNWLAATGLLWLVLALLVCGLMALSMRGGGQAPEQTPAPGRVTGDSKAVPRTASTEIHTNLKERNDE